MLKIPTDKPDPIFGILHEFNQDSREDKISLISGVYMNEEGYIPLLSSVKAAQIKRINSRISKNYLPIDGDHIYNMKILSFLLDNSTYSDHYKVVQTPGGTGAIYLVARLMHKLLPHARAWISKPSWPNHQNIFSSNGIDCQFYRYFCDNNGMLDIDAMLADLNDINSGDILVLHTCCHNPSGVDIPKRHWDKILHLVQQKKCYVLFDSAYIGFAHGVSQDKEIVNFFIEHHVSCFCALSFSKNFSLYNERVGALCVLFDDHKLMVDILGQLKLFARTTYSNPPAYGAQIVKSILSSLELYEIWERELQEMNVRLKQTRSLFVKRMHEISRSNFDYINKQVGLFSILDLSVNQIKILKEQYGIYLIDSGRMNIASINKKNLDTLCTAITSVL